MVSQTKHLVEMCCGWNGKIRLSREFPVVHHLEYECPWKYLAFRIQTCLVF